MRITEFFSSEIRYLNQKVGELMLENGELKKENIKLKEFKDKIEENRFFFKAQMELLKPKTAREAEYLQETKKIYEELFMKELKCLEEENINLKDEIERLEFNLKSRKSRKQLMEEENNELRLQIAELMGERDGKQMKIEELEKEIDRLNLLN